MKSSMLSDMDLNNSQYRYKYRIFSECGLRWKNEDTIGVVEMPEQRRSLFILCDGMGGHRNGDMASQTIVKAMSNYWLGNSKRQDCEKKIIDTSNEAMVELVKKAYCGMGMTMAMIAIDGNMLYTAHCGDSRIYTIALNMADSVVSIICETILKLLLKAGPTLQKDSFMVSLGTFLKSISSESDYRAAADS